MEGIRFIRKSVNLIDIYFRLLSIQQSHETATREIVVLVVLTLPIAFIAGYAFNSSLQWTSVVSVTIISSTGGMNSCSLY